jgi:peptidoglycan/LPS O-acetylase OafA/YrhL
MVVAASATLRLLIVVSPLAFFPWQQRLFPVEIMFFVAGMLAYRHSRQLEGIFRNGKWCVPIVGIFIVFGGWLMPWPATTTWYNSFIIAAIFYLTVPAIFAATKRSDIDRVIGEFSYPIYLLHITLSFFFHPPLLLPLCIVASAPLVFLVDRPLEHWRNNRLRAHSVVVAALQPD